MSRRVAFLWGSNANKHYPTLKYARRDVERLRNVLSSRRYGFEVVTPHNGTDPHDIHKAIRTAITSCAPDDVFVSYFSGHGQLIGSKLYFVLDKSVPSEASTMFSSAWLMDALEECRARKRLLILDCCYAGATAGVKGSSIDVVELFPKHREERVLYASGKLEPARELPELEGSFLTHVLCRSLDGAPPGNVPLSRVLDSLQCAAVAYNRQVSSSHQVPVPFLSGAQQDDFHFTSLTDPPARGDTGQKHPIAVPIPPRKPGDHVVKRAVSAVRTGLRAAASDGQGAYIFAMLAFGLAALFFHESFRGQSQALDHLQRYIEQQQASWLRSGNTPILNDFLLPEKTQSLCNAFLALRLDSAYETFTKAARPQIADDRSLHVEPTTIQNAMQLWTSGDRRNALLIPRFLTYSPDSDHTATTSTSTCASAASTPVWFSTARRCAVPSFENSIALGDAITSVSTLLGPVFSQDNEYRIDSFYYIAPEGAIRYIQADYLRPETLEARPAKFDEGYAHNIISSFDAPNKENHCSNWPFKEVLHLYRKQLTTSIYFEDMRGVVETACYPVKTGDGKISGAFCADVAIPEALTTSHLDAMRDVLDIEEPDTVWDAAHATNTKTDTDPILRVIAFQPPIGTHASNPSESWRVAKVHPKLSMRQTHVLHPWNWTSLSLSAISLIMGGIVLVMAFRGKLGRQQSILSRGLQYGLLEVSGGKITGANDRAEEILRTKLPRLGIRSARVQSGKTFAPLINEQKCVLLPPHGRPPSEADICTHEGRIRDRATDGLTSVFYAWVTAAEMWIKITSTVILLPSGTERVFCALDTAIDGEHKELLATVQAQFTRQEEA